MKTTHTPGPWRLHDMEEATVVDKNGKTIGVCLSISHADPENEANARLIAAAPELLSALRNIADVAAKMTEQSGSAQPAFVRDEARAAIARATTLSP